MREEFEAEAEAAALVLVLQDGAEGVEIGRLAVSRQAHHFVFIAVLQEAEILGDRRVVQSERMRKSNCPKDVQAVSPARCPHGAGEVAQAVGGEHRGAIKRRNEKCAGQMCTVVLDAMKARANAFRIGVERLRQGFGNTGELRENFGAFQREARHPQRVEHLGAQPRPGIARNSDVVHFPHRETCFAQTVADGLGGKTRRVFYAVEALFFTGGNQTTVANNGRRGVAVIRIDSENVHEGTSVYIRGVIRRLGLGRSRTIRGAGPHARNGVSSRFLRITDSGGGGTIRSGQTAPTDATTKCVPRENSARRLGHHPREARAPAQETAP